MKIKLNVNYNLVYFLLEKDEIFIHKANRSIEITKKIKIKKCKLNFK